MLNKTGAPTKNEGVNGDIIVRNTTKGTFLFAKCRNRWYNQKLTSFFSKKDSIAKPLRSCNINCPTNLTLKAGSNIIFDAASDIELNADGGDITFKDNTTELASIFSGGLELPSNAGVHFNTADATDKIYGDGSDILISKDDTDVWTFFDAETRTEIPIKIKEAASAVADTAAYGQIWIKNATPK